MQTFDLGKFKPRRSHVYDAGAYKGGRWEVKVLLLIHGGTK
jgi:hypothetical protein